jgi:hypothetical protein
LILLQVVVKPVVLGALVPKIRLRFLPIGCNAGGADRAAYLTYLDALSPAALQVLQRANLRPRAARTSARATQSSAWALHHAADATFDIMPHVSFAGTMGEIGSRRCAWRTP